MAFGNNTTVEYDIVIDGKPAEKSIKDVEDAQEDLDKTVTKTSKNISVSWKAMGASALVAATAMTVMMKGALDVERATFGLNEQTKKYITQASSMYAVNQTVIAGYVQMGKAAGLNGEQIKKMIDQGIALGRSYPHESTETMIDALKEFYATGVEASFVTDVLEDNMGKAWVTTATFAEKMEVLEKATQGVNEEFDKTDASKVDKSFNDITIASDELGKSLNNLAGESGIFSAVSVGLDWMTTKAKEATVALRNLKATAMQATSGGGGGGGSWGDPATTPLDETITPNIKGGGYKPPGSLTGGSGGKNKTAKAAATGRTSSNTADREREIALRANERFWDDYNQTIMDATEYELNLLNERYTEYAEHITDKVALEEWFSEEQARIMEEDRYNTDLYADLKMRTFDDMADAITDFALTGEADFKGMADSIISEIIRINAQQLVSGIFGGSGGGSLLGGLFGSITANAKGNAFSNGSVTAFASGGVVNSPTTFPMSGGTGLMAEDGAEAIMPLTRTSTGNLGVETTASPVNVNVNNYGNDEVSVSQNGDSVDIIITQIANGITRGTSQVGSAIEGRYGVRKS